MKKSGTIEEESNFNPETDALRIRLAIKDGKEKDIGVEHTMAEMLVQRSNAQRQQIQQHYESLFSVGICEDLQSVVNKGNFYESVRALLSKPRTYDAHCLRQAIEEANDSTICEILCTRSDSEITELQQCYETEYESVVREDIDMFINDQEHKQFFLAILQSPRDGDTTVDESGVTECVNKLIQAEKNKWDSTVCPDFMTILSTLNFSELRLIFKEFHKREGGNMEMLESSIRKHCKDELMKSCLIMWVKSIKNVTQLFSELLYQSVTSLTADSARVIRIVIGRSEIDLTQIKSHYMMQYNKQLQLAVQQKCGNDTAYSNIITMIIKN